MDFDKDGLRGKKYTVGRIIEAKGLGEEGYIQRGVELLRELRKRASI